MNAIKSWYDYISEFKYNFQSINSTFTSLVMQIVRIDAHNSLAKQDMASRARVKGILSSGLSG